MSLLPSTLPICQPAHRVFTLLPGPTRKRTPSRYAYQVTYRCPDAEAVGCVLIWEVTGGRLSYQIALERDDAGNLHLHCTCADAVFRGEEQGRFCKHVHGLLDFGRPVRALTLPPRRPLCVGA